MAVTDDITNEIVNLCKKKGGLKFSREVIGDYIEGNTEEFTDEVIEKLKAEGIEVVQ